ncbi:MAG TPA: type II toxin-antitoxin system antitoxin SocA domain-containing protein [Kofleriaceae bacterium]|nr:type II toxin-antitoxin system antitoxin SocA domain-containing protein [Kofleriaceae bacterium]
MTVDQCADYIIWKLTEDGRPLNVLKLQKLAYYVQAWHLAYHDKPMFPARFEAWIHGPVNRTLYDRFRNSHQLYGAVTLNDVRPGFDPSSLSEDARVFIDSVLEAYGGFSGSQLEELTHRELPWQKARGSLGPTERCENAIDEKTMSDYYHARL